MEKPYLSIVICTYNGALFLKEQLDSLFGQTYPNFEIIAVDDCSTDSTFEILKEYAANGKLKAFQNERTLGLNKNFQDAIQKASGDYILFCDQDDVWEAEKLEIMISHIDGSLLYYHDSAWIDENGYSLSKKQSDRFMMASSPHPLSFVPLNCVTGHACMIQKQLLDYSLFPFPEHIYYDNWLGYIAATYGDIHYISQCLVRYRIHRSNLTVSGEKSTRKSTRIDKNALEILYNQLDSFYQFTPENASYKAFLRKLRDTYKSNHLKDKTVRVILFLRHFRKLTVFRKRNLFRKLSFCFKMSYKKLPNYFRHFQ